jgi:hypothetical protein
MGNKPKPRRTYKKATEQTSKRVSMDLNDAVSHAWNVQELIDNYNNDLINNPTVEFFEDVNLASNAIVIRPFRENYIKEYVEETKTAAAIGFRRIDKRVRTTDQEDYVFSPFKFINSGILAAAPIEFLEERNMTLGDVIYIKPVRWKDCRFYLNRQLAIRDYVHSQENWSLVFFEGYFNISQFDVELSISNETFKKKYMSSVMSPIYGKTTLEELIDHHAELEEKVKQEQEELSKKELSTSHVGQEVYIKDIKDSDSKKDINQMNDIEETFDENFDDDSDFTN